MKRIIASLLILGAMPVAAWSQDGSHSRWTVARPEFQNVADQRPSLHLVSAQMPVERPAAQPAAAPTAGIQTVTQQVLDAGQSYGGATARPQAVFVAAQRPVETRASTAIDPTPTLVPRQQYGTRYVSDTSVVATSPAQVSSVQAGSVQVTPLQVTASPQVVGYQPQATGLQTVNYPAATTTFSAGSACCAPTVTAYQPANACCQPCVPQTVQYAGACPTPVQCYSPVAAVDPVYVGRGLLGQPKAYVEGQPVRNFFRWILP